jgi:hypothetical protein
MDQAWVLIVFAMVALAATNHWRKPPDKRKTFADAQRKARARKVRCKNGGMHRG